MILPLLARGDNASLRRAGLEYARYVLEVNDAFAECNARFLALREYYATLNGERK